MSQPENESTEQKEQLEEPTSKESNENTEEIEFVTKQSKNDTIDAITKRIKLFMNNSNKEISDNVTKEVAIAIVEDVEEVDLSDFYVALRMIKKHLKGRGLL
jgi:hypothetical protein